ncbi:histidine phosphatase superfamily [Biscogniauxia mediterranea]|nr:histidine phosphatase superfamily [Biscogniauxia mediterranea]
MSLEVIYVTRHGFRSPWGVDPATGNYTAFVRSPTGLPTDPPLTSHGVEQASELAQHLLKLDPPIEQVYSSPYYRCLQTIQPFVSLRRGSMQVRGQTSTSNSGEDSFRIRPDKGLSEWYGLAHFSHPTAASLDELQTFFPELDANYVSSPAPSPNGELIPELYDRVAACIQAIIERSDREGKKAILVCTHAAVIIALGRVLTGQLPEDATKEDFGAFTCGLSIYRRQGSDRSEPVTALTTKRTTLSRGKMYDNDAICGQMQDREARSKAILQTDSLCNVDRHPSDTQGPESAVPWSSGWSAYGGWTCEVDSDCSFLRHGKERGWKFSGDESFIDVDRQGLPPLYDGVGSKLATGETKLESGHDSSGGNSKL